MSTLPSSLHGAAMLRPVCALLALGLTLVSPVRADDGIPAKTLADLKAATVFVKLEAARGTASGSGFVIRADKGAALVATNEHVVHPPPAAGAVKKVEVVFHSGRARQEVVLPAEVVAADAERDLAILRVKDAPETATPIDLAAKAEPSETMTVWTLGFPFGEALATAKGNPALTIGKGSVSSLREDDAGDLAVVQIDGDINPGNSGGPVVDGKGRLVGVAVAKVKNTNIGLAIPPAELAKMLQGRISASSVRVLRVDKDVAEVEITLQFIDPLEKVTSATVRLVRTGDPLPKPGKGGEIPLLSGGTTHEVKVSGQRGVVKVKLPVDRHLMQVVYANDARKDIRAGAVVGDLPTLARGLSARPAEPGAKPVNPLPSGDTKVGDLTVNSVELAPSHKPGLGQNYSVPVPCLTWAADGKGFYAVDHVANTVRLLSFPGLKEEAKLEVGKECSWLSPSKEGVVLTVAGEQEGWVLDPKTLKKGTTFPVNKAKRVVSAPPLGVGYVCEQGVGPFPVGGTLRVVDLKTGKKLKEYDAKDFDRQCGFATAVLSADGKHLFTSGGVEQLIQLAVDGEQVTYVGTSDRLIQGVFQQPVVSADGKLVCAPSGGGNYRIKGTKEGFYTTAVFATGNLSDPLLQLKTGAYPQAVGFDTTAGLIYAQSYDDHLIVLDREGSKLKSHKLVKDQPLSVIQLLPHPDGRKLLLLAAAPGWGGGLTVYAIELPAK